MQKMPLYRKALADRAVGAITAPSENDCQAEGMFPTDRALIYSASLFAGSAHLSGFPG